MVSFHTVWREDVPLKRVIVCHEVFAAKKNNNYDPTHTHTHVYAFCWGSFLSLSHDRVQTLWGIVKTAEDCLPNIDTYPFNNSALIDLYMNN